VLGSFATLFAARTAADPIVSVRQAVGEIERGDLDVDVPVYDGTEIGLLQAGFNRMAEGLREREKIRELFGMHVGEEVAREAMERDSGLGGEQRDVAVLFVDVIGSTAIAVERPPQEVVELLNRFFGIVVEVVNGCGGWVNKFEGDAALAVFGAPEPLEDAAGCALRAGRELSERLAREVEDAGAGIGVSFGAVVAGNIGSDQRFEYTVIGDPVNEAARLTELAKERPGRLLASGDAVEAASAAEASRWNLADSVELRGRSQPTRLAISSAAPGAEPDRGGEARPE
jgi:adenylate cyclase